MTRVATKAYSLRPAVQVDIPQLEHLIELSALSLQQQDYSEQQIRGALGTVFGVDTQLIEDSTYYVIELQQKIVACGGWSKRETLFGSDANKTQSEDPLLNPNVDAARIRAFFVHPQFARLGLGLRLIHACEKASKSAGFKRMVLVATVTGERLYAKAGYQAVKRFDVELVNQQIMPVVSMEKALR